MLKTNQEMKNSVLMTVEFDFKGQSYAPSMRLDLDEYFRMDKNLNDCYRLLAQANGIGLYSYELEVMEIEPIQFSEPQGVAESYVQDGRVDWDELKKAWREQFSFDRVATIATKYFNVENMNEHPKLAAALLEAYAFGKDDGRHEMRMESVLNEGFYG